MARWKIFVLGDLSVRSSRGDLIRLPPHAWSLLTFLISSPAHSASRAVLAAALWPETNELAARHCLASTLWRIRGAFKDSPSMLRADDDQLSLRLGPSVWVDAIAFNRRIEGRTLGQKPLGSSAERTRMRRVLDTYRGEFAASIDAPWCLIERQRLRMLFLDGLFVLASSHCAANEWTSAAAIARRLCTSEPLREDAHRLLMTAWARTGNRALALRQFEECRGILARELNVQPMRETVELYTRLTREAPLNGHAPLPLASDDFRSAMLDARHRVHEALGVLETALATLNERDPDDPVLPP